MKSKRISFGKSKDSLTHNNREFVADNVDPFRTPDNITFINQPIAEAYDQLFAESTERYNAKQIIPVLFWYRTMNFSLRIISFITRHTQVARPELECFTAELQTNISIR